jgi:hypothetical protein
VRLPNVAFTPAQASEFRRELDATGLLATIGAPGP